ncbi:063R [Invertebrate iridescent virus 6]|uniref:063R n=1 Tax=Invertebrate iridescent virus 6 TaxID=176652 RepID=Q91G41_IIV6|nr:063R [Invertebrate iridescent virus 6]AAK81991.1 063R [Invertebrate iridescent virus 6]QMS79631.1 hypothetical protein IIV6-T1_068 [Invertebrate iridescent virus 6]
MYEFNRSKFGLYSSSLKLFLFLKQSISSSIIILTSSVAFCDKLIMF